MREDSVPVIFGIKLKQYREERGMLLKEFAQKAGISTSYLNEIEKGKKYPKSDKILSFARALEVPYDELVSLKLEQGLNPLESILDSPIIRELPLDIFGISQQDVIGLFTKAPKKAVALIRTLDEISRTYGVQVEHFFYAMLRSYQEVHENYFADIEKAVQFFLKDQGWESKRSISKEMLREVLESKYGYEIDKKTFPRYPHLSSFRSIWIEGTPTRLLINPELNSPQQAFQMAREIGYQVLQLRERGITSSRSEISSFEQVLNDFRASYFAGAVMVNAQLLTADLGQLFEKSVWNPDGFLKVLTDFAVTPEIFLYRLTQIVPAHFHLRNLHFLRFTHQPDHIPFQLTKQFNMSQVLLPAGLGQNEHYCRRWLPISILNNLASQPTTYGNGPVVGAQVVRFDNQNTEYLYITLARPLTLTHGANTSVSIGFRFDGDFKRKVRFWNDPEIPHVTLNETCERCGLSPSECDVRAAPPDKNDQHLLQKNRKKALEDLFVELGSQPKGNGKEQKT